MGRKYTGPESIISFGPGATAEAPMSSPSSPPFPLWLRPHCLESVHPAQNTHGKYTNTPISIIWWQVCDPTSRLSLCRALPSSRSSFYHLHNMYQWRHASYRSLLKGNTRAPNSAISGRFARIPHWWHLMQDALSVIVELSRPWRRAIHGHKILSHRGRFARFS